jgi:hypothetical protein
MTNCPEPGTGTDHRTVPADVQSLAPSGQVSTEELGCRGVVGGEVAQPAAAIAAAVNQVRTRHRMSLTPPDCSIHYERISEHSERRAGPLAVRSSHMALRRYFMA